LLGRGRAVGTGTPAALKASVGDAIVEIEGRGVERVLSILQDLVTVRATVKTERGYRIGVCGSRERLAQLTGMVPQFESITIRPVTLEDVYFAQTQTASSLPPTREFAEDPA
jgi:hypothetical protein